MTISALYRGTLTNQDQFLQMVGVEKNTFDLLLSQFQMVIPKKLSLEERLFAALYAEHHALDAGKIGKLLQYANSGRDGGKFLTQSRSALALARSQMSTPKDSEPTTVPKQPSATEVSKKRQMYGCAMYSPILISYRNEQGKNMHGAFYDHYTLGHITEHETYISKDPQQEIDTFTAFIKNDTTHALGINDAYGERIIPIVKDITDQSSGLLVIPGHASNDNDVVRKNHEQLLIKQARIKGQPILAICAGSWRLWEAYGGVTKEVTGHLYSQMPRILNDGGIGFNKQIHRIELQPNTLVHGAMNLRNQPLHDEPTVNSVHWKVPSTSSLPNLLEVSAKAVHDQDLEPRNRQGNMHPEREIESFETKYGAPVIGIQWHPEAYYKNKEAVLNESERHLNLIRYMAKAGDAYQAKRQMTTELHSRAGQLLSKHGLFSSKENNDLMIKPSSIKACLK